MGSVWTIDKMGVETHPLINERGTKMKKLNEKQLKDLDTLYNEQKKSLANISKKFFDEDLITVDEFLDYMKSYKKTYDFLRRGIIRGKISYDTLKNVQVNF